MGNAARRKSAPNIASALVLLFALWAPAAIAQNQDTDTGVPLALRPVDNSSPRDTLRGFLSNVEILIEEWRKNDLGESAARAPPRHQRH